MELIVTRSRPDLDAFATAVGAVCLFPKARVLTPELAAPEVARAAEGGLAAVSEMLSRQLDPGRLDRLVLCGCRRQDRLGVVADWLVPGHRTELVAFDREPASERDLPFVVGRIDSSVGAASTLLAEELKARGLAPSREQASLLLAGIYHATRCLTSEQTSARDLEAAAWLRRQGAETSRVRETLFDGADPMSLDLVERLIRALTIEDIDGWRVGVAVLESSGPVSARDERLGQVLGLCTLDLLAVIVPRPEGSWYAVVTRSPELFLRQALSELGAVGEDRAVSASLAGMEPVALRKRLQPLLKKALPRKSGASFLTAPFFGVPADTTVASARRQLVRFGPEAAVVLAVDGQEARLAGRVTLSLLDAAHDLGLGEAPISAVMSGELDWMSPEASVTAVETELADPRKPFIVVGNPEAGTATGWVTPRSLLRRRVAERGVGRPQVEQDITPILERGVSPRLLAQIHTVREVAARFQLPVYLVGGPVRDLLLGLPLRDLDLCVEGPLPGLVAQLGKELGGRLAEHREFLTASLELPGGDRLDFASCRADDYPAMAALPRVRPARFEDDLRRRDFTINALALRIWPGEGLPLLDSVDGRRDLAARTLRTFHSLSFFDDPTRVLRGVRFELRLGFRFGQEALRQIEAALTYGAFTHLSADRLRGELVPLLDDPATVEQALDRLAELGLLTMLAPEIGYRATVRQRVREALAARDAFLDEKLAVREIPCWRLVLTALVGGLPAHQRAAVAQRLGLVGEDRRTVVGDEETRRQARYVLGEVRSRSYEIAEALDDLAEEELLVLFAEGGSERAGVDAYVRRMRSCRLTVRGADLVARGLAPGPEVGKVLRAVRRARLDGLIQPREELAFALRVAGLRAG